MFRSVRAAREHGSHITVLLPQGTHQISRALAAIPFNRLRVPRQLAALDDLLDPAVCTLTQLQVLIGSLLRHRQISDELSGRTRWLWRWG